MSEKVDYKPTVTVGSSAGIAVLAAAGANATVAGACDQFKKLMGPEKWVSTYKRESLLQEAMEANFEDLLKSKESGDTKDFLKVIAMTKALDSVNNLSYMLKMEHGKELKDISEECNNYIEKIDSKGFTNNLAQIADDLNSRLRAITSDAHQKLVNAEESVLRNTVMECLKNTGFDVTQRGGALRATKGTTCIWTQIDQKARMELDVSGFSGLSCQKEIIKFEKELESQGISLNRESFQMHGNKEGGDLAKKLSDFFDQKENGTFRHKQEIIKPNNRTKAKAKSKSTRKQKNYLKIRG